MKKILNRAKTLLARTDFGKRIQLRYGSRGRLVQSVSDYIDGPKLNLACGELHIPGYINIDSSDYCKPDLQINTQDIVNHFEKDSISNITIIHGLGYLSYHEARTFFRNAHLLLKEDCELVIETPSLDLLAQNIGVAESNSVLTAEMIFPIFATDFAGPTHGTCYQFAWTQYLLTAELLEAGFAKVRSESPLTHGQMKNRDMRLVASK